MPDETDIQDAIATNATGPKRVEGQDVTVEQHSLRDQIEAARFVASNQAARKKLGIRRVRMVPPDTVGPV